MPSNHSFYFDNLMKNNQLTCRIVRMKSINQNPWDSKGSQYDSSIGSFDKISNNDNYQGYEMLRGFVQGDFTITARNSWSPLKSLGSEITSWLSDKILGKDYSGVDFLNMINDTTQKTAAWLKNLGSNGSLTEAASKFTSSQFINYTDYAKMYGGTDVDFPLGFSTTILCDEVGMDPREYIRRCLGDLVGRLVNPDNNDPSFLEDISGIYYGRLQAPGNFRYNPAMAKGNKPQEGTVCLFIGDSIVVRNLLIDNVDIVVSNQLTYTENGDAVPLFVKADISFTPAAYFSSADLVRALGDPTGNVRSMADLMGEGDLMNLPTPKVSDTEVDEDGNPTNKPLPGSTPVTNTQIMVGMGISPIIGLSLLTKKLLKKSNDPKVDPDDREGFSDNLNYMNNSPKYNKFW